jgi:hypothetical protein
LTLSATTLDGADIVALVGSVVKFSSEDLVEVLLSGLSTITILDGASAEWTSGDIRLGNSASMSISGLLHVSPPLDLDVAMTGSGSLIIIGVMDIDSGPTWIACSLTVSSGARVGLISVRSILKIFGNTEILTGGTIRGNAVEASVPAARWDDGVVSVGPESATPVAMLLDSAHSLALLRYSDLSMTHSYGVRSEIKPSVILGPGATVSVKEGTNVACFADVQLTIAGSASLSLAAPGFGGTLFEACNVQNSGTLDLTSVSRLVGDVIFLSTLFESLGSIIFESIGIILDASQISTGLLADTTVTDCSFSSVNTSDPQVISLGVCPEVYSPSNLPCR